jgi:proline dehydrogenase
MTTRTPATNAVLPSPAAQVPRGLALDEELKQRVPGDPVLDPLARKVARRYVAGETLSRSRPPATA